MHKNWPLTSCRLIVTSQDDVTAKLISNLFGFSLTWRNCIFAWLTKIATELLLTVHIPVILQLGEDKILIYLSKKRILTKYFILFNVESFFKLFTSFWYTLYNVFSFIMIHYRWLGVLSTMLVQWSQIRGRAAEMHGSQNQPPGILMTLKLIQCKNWYKHGSYFQNFLKLARK